jgi:polysaccharide biosynthesis transport protein
VATANRHVTSGEGTIVPSLLDYLRVVGRWKLVFLLIVLLVPATVGAVSLIQTPIYGASAEVLLTPGVREQFVDPQRVAQTQAELARIPDVVDPVLAKFPNAGLDREEFLESSSVSTTLGSDLLTFSVENSDPELAMQLATEYAHSFTRYAQLLDNKGVGSALETVRQQLSELEASGGTDSAAYEVLQREERRLLALAAGDAPSAQVVQAAHEAPKVAPRTVRNGLIAFCLGLVLALIVVFLADALDTRVKSVDAVREALGLRLLGRLATPPSRLRKSNELVMLADPSSREAEPFRALRWSLDLANGEQGARTIMITSAIDGEGKSTTVANLAVAFARAGRRVVLIDADLTDPHLHRFFSLDPQPGLTDVELGEAWLVSALRPISLEENSFGADDSSRRTEHTGSLEVLPAGSALQDPDEIDFERAIARITQRVRGRADIVLVDGPPVLRSNAIALSAHVDAVVAVVRLKHLRASALQDLGWMLEASPTTKLGFVVTGVSKVEGYGNRHRYVASEQPPKARPQPTPTVSPSAADGDGVTPARTSSKSSGRPFGGLSPREAALRSAESRREKSAQRAAAERSEPDETQDSLEDA